MQIGPATPIFNYIFLVLERGIEEDEEEIKQLREECDTFGSKPSTDPEVIK